MGLKYLLDTNILSELSKQKPNAQVVRRVEKYARQCTTASLVTHELNFGIMTLPKGKRKDNLKLFLQQLEKYNFPILSYDSIAAKIHAKYRTKLVKQGLTPAFVDGQIAAIALANELILVTRNSKDFKNYKGIIIENWFEQE